MRERIVMFKAILLSVTLSAVVAPSCSGPPPDDDLLWVSQSEDDGSYSIIEDFDPPPEVWSTVDGNQASPREEPYVPHDVKIEWTMPELPGAKNGK